MNISKLTCLVCLLLWMLLISCKKDEPTAVSNSAPYPPAHPIPADSALTHSIKVELGWTGNDPDGDSLTYDVYLGTISSPSLISSRQSGVSFDPGVLADSTTYYWQIVAYDDHDHSASGPIWSFRIEAHNDSPGVPFDPIPADLTIGQSPATHLVWSCTDPDGDTLAYDVYFGMESSPPLVSSGQFDTTYHPGTLADTTTYYWKIVAYDHHNFSATSPVWSFTTGYAGMALVPAGSYIMGSNAINYEYSVPEHLVTIPSFYLDQYEVTNAQYKKFCDATGHTYPWDPYFYNNYFLDPIYANYPVINVYWDEARAYASWAGKRLPSEAEWEYAAKGSADNRLWPWGDIWNAAFANIHDNPADGYEFISPVGHYPNGVSPTGCYDMAGNVWEWCEDDWHENYIGAPNDGSAWIDSPRDFIHMRRGGAWNDPSEWTRCAIRSGTDFAYYDIGFRCAKNP